MKNKANARIYYVYCIGKTKVLNYVTILLPISKYSSKSVKFVQLIKLKSYSHISVLLAVFVFFLLFQ